MHTPVLPMLESTDETTIVEPTGESVILEPKDKKQTTDEKKGDDDEKEDAKRNRDSQADYLKKHYFDNCDPNVFHSGFTDDVPTGWLNYLADTSVRRHPRCSSHGDITNTMLHAISDAEQLLQAAHMEKSGVLPWTRSTSHLVLPGPF